MEKKKVVYISGKITGDAGYKKKFEKAEAELRAAGFIPLNPAKLPPEIDNAAAMEICVAMINASDAVLMLPGWASSVGAHVELAYSKYIRKPAVASMEALLEVMARGDRK